MSIALLAESVADKVLAGERITRDDALELYRLPLNELGELAHLRRNAAADAHIRAKYPHINIHGFSPPEFQHFAEVFKMPLREVIVKFMEAGLGSIPGGGGEILVDSVRERISPLKCKSDAWLEVMRVAHGLG